MSKASPDTRRAWRMLGEFLLALAASSVAYLLITIAYSAIVSVLPGLGGLGVLLLIAFLSLAQIVPFVGPAVVAIAGLVGGRVAYVVAPVVFLVFLPIISRFGDDLMMQLENMRAAKASKLEQRAFLPLEGTPSIVAINGEAFCRSPCMQILATTNYDVASKRFSVDEPWTIHRLAEGATCLQPENLVSLLEFVAAGYVDRCATRAAWQPIDGIILVNANENHYRAAQELVGESYRGRVFEAYERRGGTDRLLGRWLDGKITQTQLNLLSKPRQSQSVGQSFAPEDFYAALLKAPILPNRRPGGASSDEVLAALAELIDTPDAFWGAANTYYEIAQAMPIEQQPLLREHMRRLAESDSARQMEVAFGVLARSITWSPEDSAFMQPYVEAALLGTDMRLAEKALDTLYVFPVEQRTAINAALVEMAFSRPMQDKGNLWRARLAESLMRIPGTFEPTVRRRAEIVLREQHNMSEQQTVALLVIMADGDEAARADAFDVVQTFDGHRFERMIKIIDEYGWDKLSGTEAGWNDRELQLIVSRIARVPNDRLQDHLNAIRARGIGEPFRNAIIADLEQRLSGQSKSDRILQRYLEDMRR